MVVFSLYLFTPHAYKAFPSVGPQNAQSLGSFGNLCSAVKRLPDSAVLPTGLAKHDDEPVASGVLANNWRGEHRGTQVAIKEFRTYPLRDLEEAKKVRIQFARDDSL